MYSGTATISASTLASVSASHIIYSVRHVDIVLGFNNKLLQHPCNWNEEHMGVGIVYPLADDMHHTRPRLLT